MKFVDLTGQKFGKITVLKRVEDKEYKKRSVIQYLVQCECGKEFKVLGQSLTRTKVPTRMCKACSSTTHGLKLSRLYGVWANMKARCYNPKANNYKNYGKRGIRVCKEWKKDFKSFYEWAIKSGYKEGIKGEYTLERIDVNKNYCPENCTWVTITEQEQNKRNSIRITYKGETKSLKEWAKVIGIKEVTLRGRYQNGWSIERMLTEPLNR